MHRIRHGVTANQQGAAGQFHGPLRDRLGNTAQRQHFFDPGQGLRRRDHVDTTADQKRRLAAARQQRNAGLELGREVGQVGQRAVIGGVAIDNDTAGLRMVPP